MSWLRAAIAGVIVVLLAFVLLVWVPNYVVTHWSGTARSTRVAGATGFFTVALVGLLVLLRRAQARGWTR
jgi:hypothetical protein